MRQQPAEAQAAADEAADGTDAASLQAALESMANKPVDQDVIDWATEVLDGKIDEMTRGARDRGRGRTSRDARHRDA